MPTLTNDRHEAFAKALAKGQSAAKAYITADFAPDRGNAVRLAAKDNIKTRVAEIKQDQQATATEPNKVNGKDAETGQWIPGNRNGGRPKGARNRLGQQFVEDLHHRWQLSGAAALEYMAKNDQSGFVKVVANVLPRELDATIDLTVGIIAEIRDYKQAFQIAKSYLADEPLLIESEAEGLGENAG